MMPSYFLPKNWPLISQVGKLKASFMARNSLISYFHLKSRPTMPLVTMPNWQEENQVSNFQLAFF